MKPREAMLASLRAMTKESLRPRGFTGSIPHLRRITEDQVCLVSFQFHSSGGSFVVEVAECGPDGVDTPRGHKAASTVTAQDINDPRPRLGSASFPDGDHWFVFGKRNSEPDSDQLQPEGTYRAVAADVLRQIETQAEGFWEQARANRST